MNRTSSAARKFIDTSDMASTHAVAIAANDNDDDSFDVPAFDVVAILLRDGREMPAG